MLTDLSFLEIGEQWPPDSERRRLADYETNRLLFAGEHQNVFSDYLRLLRQDDQAILELIINLPKRLSTLWADLLLGETPRFEAGDTDSDEQATIDRIVSDNELAITAYEIAIDTSRYGDGLFKLRVQDRAAIIEAQSPSTWFPVTQPGNIRNITHHVLAWTWEQDNTRYLEAILCDDRQYPARPDETLFGMIRASSPRLTWPEPEDPKRCETYRTAAPSCWRPWPCSVWP